MKWCNFRQVESLASSQLQRHFRQLVRLIQGVQPCSLQGHPGSSDAPIAVSPIVYQVVSLQRQSKEPWRSNTETLPKGLTGCFRSDSIRRPEITIFYWHCDATHADH